MEHKPGNDKKRTERAAKIGKWGHRFALYFVLAASSYLIVNWILRFSNPEFTSVPFYNEIVIGLVVVVIGWIVLNAGGIFFVSYIFGFLIKMMLDGRREKKQLERKWQKARKLREKKASNKQSL